MCMHVYQRRPEIIITNRKNILQNENNDGNVELKWP